MKIVILLYLIVLLFCQKTQKNVKLARIYLQIIMVFVKMELLITVFSTSILLTTNLQEIIVKNA